MSSKRTDDSDAELTEAALKARRVRIALAREDPATFAELILRDRQTGEEIENQPFHDEWHEILDRYPRVILWTHPESGKTSNLAVARVLWEVGKNPQLSVAFVSKTYTQAEKLCRTVAEFIAGESEASKLVRAVFPHLKPGKKWSDGQWTIERPIVDKNPTAQAFGIDGTITGDRIDLLVSDDLLDHTNTRTPGQRQSVLEWWDNSIPDRMSDDGRIWHFANAWHPKDPLHELEKRDAYYGARYPIVDKNGEPLWPAKFPPERIAEIKAETPPVVWAAKYMTRPRDEGAARFSADWLARCLDGGRGLSPLYDLDPDDLEQGAFTLTGVDVAMGKRKTSGDLTSLVTILVQPNERRRILWIESGRWKWPEILSRIIAAHERYGSLVYVEDEGQQRGLVQFAERESRVLPVRPLQGPGRNKSDPVIGIEGLAVEFERGDWILPCDDYTHEEGGADVQAHGHEPFNTELNELILEILHYNPAAHIGDRLVATWLCREAARRICASRRKSASNDMVRALGDEPERSSALEGVRFD